MHLQTGVSIDCIHYHCYLSSYALCTIKGNTELSRGELSISNILGSLWELKALGSSQKTSSTSHDQTLRESVKDSEK